MRIPIKQRSKLRDEQCTDVRWNSKKPMENIEQEQADELVGRKPKRKR